MAHSISTDVCAYHSTHEPDGVKTETALPARQTRFSFGENNAMIEGEFVGKHIAEFAGIPATGKNVSVPICVVYDLEDDRIKRGRVYFEMPALMQQLGVTPAAG